MNEIIFFIVFTMIKIAAVIGIVLFLVSYTVMAERRISAMIQDRIGPNRVGIPLTNIRLFGLGHPIADACKLLLKEEFTPAHVKKFYFHLAPILTMTPTIIVLCVIPFASDLDMRPLGTWLSQFFTFFNEWTPYFKTQGVIADLDIGALFIFAIAGISIYGIMLAGWSSNSQYPFLGSIRASAQLISYELCMGLSVVPIFLIVQSFNLSKIVQYQIEHGWFVLPLISSFDLANLLLCIPLVISFIIFLISAFAETNRLPFDMPECESELVSGYHTEYSSMKFALFFLGEYTAIIMASAFMVTLFFGGWSLPFPWFNGQIIPWHWWLMTGQEMPWWFSFVHIGVFLLKIAAFLFFFIWIRWTLPRFRYDQLMKLSWKFLIPIAFVNIFFTALIIALIKNPNLTFLNS